MKTQGKEESGAQVICATETKLMEIVYGLLHHGKYDEIRKVIRHKHELLLAACDRETDALKENKKLLTSAQFLYDCIHQNYLDDSELRTIREIKRTFFDRE